MVGAVLVILGWYVITGLLKLLLNAVTCLIKILLWSMILLALGALAVYVLW